MSRTSRRFGILAFVCLAAFAIWAVRARTSSKFSHAPIRDAFISALTNPVAFGKDHFRGGVGIVFAIDPKSGLVEIHNVVAGSPAANAGLEAGDRIVEVNGLPTAGRTLAENGDMITGSPLGRVKLTVQRAGSTNRVLAIDRTSWGRLKEMGMPRE